MFRSTLVLACLVCTGEARMVQIDGDVDTHLQSHPEGKSNELTGPSRQLARLVLDLTFANAFSPSASIHTSRFHRHANRVPGIDLVTCYTPPTDKEQQELAAEIDAEVEQRIAIDRAESEAALLMRESEYKPDEVGIPTTPVRENMFFPRDAGEQHYWGLCQPPQAWNSPGKSSSMEDSPQAGNSPQASWHKNFLPLFGPPPLLADADSGKSTDAEKWPSWASIPKIDKGFTVDVSKADSTEADPAVVRAWRRMSRMSKNSPREDPSMTPMKIPRQSSQTSRRTDGVTKTDVEKLPEDRAQLARLIMNLRNRASSIRRVSSAMFEP